MKIYIKRAIIIFLVYLLLLLNYTIIDEIHYLDEYGTSNTAEATKKIGTVSIYSSKVNYLTENRLTGHVWIYIYNTSDKPFYINDMFVPPDNGITFGTTANPDMEYKGIWYNVEGFNKYYKNNISLKGDFYENEIEYVENFLENHNKWNLIYNCTPFASELWNNLTAGKDRPVMALTPATLHYQIMDRYDYLINEPYIIFDYMQTYD